MAATTLRCAAQPPGLFGGHLLSKGGCGQLGRVMVLLCDPGGHKVSLLRLERGQLLRDLDGNEAEPELGAP